MELPYEYAKELIFKKRKISISSDYRPLIKISQIILVLYLASSRNSANIFKLQLLDWAFKSSEREKVLISLIEDPLRSVPIINMDPTVNRAIHFAMADKLIAFNPKTNKFVLLDKGIQLAKDIMVNQDILQYEKYLLNKIGTRVTDKIISVVFKERNLK